MTVRALLLSLLLWLVVTACAPPPAPDVPPPADPALRAGYELYGERCQACHWVTPTNHKGKGPTLAGLADRAGATVPGVDARAYIEQSIVQPGAYVVPGYRNNMPDDYAERLYPEDIAALVDYLMALD